METMIWRSEDSSVEDEQSHYSYRLPAKQVTQRTFIVRAVDHTVALCNRFPGLPTFAFPGLWENREGNFREILHT